MSWRLFKRSSVSYGSRCFCTVEGLGNGRFCTYDKILSGMSKVKADIWRDKRKQMDLRKTATGTALITQYFKDSFEITNTSSNANRPTSNFENLS